MDYKKILPQRAQNSHKGTFGKVLNIAGSHNYTGAAYLSSIAALRVGAGYVTLACPQELTPQIASLTPDVTFLSFPDKILPKIALIEQNLHKFDVVSLGCGLGLEPQTVFFLEKTLKLLPNSTMPVVIDADGLNIIAKSEIKVLPENCILTPHEAEMSRLLGCTLQKVAQDRELCAKEAAKKWGCTTILKGRNTVICSPSGEVVINKSGNSALAKAGSGDVLTGIIAGLLAQGCGTFDAAVLGVYLHGLCGEIASAKQSEYSVLASDLIDFIPSAITRL